MPALITHVLQSGKCLEKIKPEIAKRGIEVNDDFAGYVAAAAISHDTLGLLLGTGYDNCFVTAHEKNTDAFFLAAIKFIKENGLKQNAAALAFLYGHIMHYALDISTHPLVYYMTQKHPARFLVAALDAHTLFEAWVDSEMEKEEPAFSPKLAFRNKIGKAGIDPLINAVYETVHGQKNAARGYRCGIRIWQFYQRCIRSMMLSHAKEYIPDFKGMLNENGAQFQHPLTGEPMSATFRQLHDKSIDLACELIMLANANIYDNADNEDTLKKAFGNSYDSGMPWNDPREKQYFKQY